MNKQKFCKQISFLLIILFLSIFVFQEYVVAQTLKWTQTENLSTRPDGAGSITSDADYIYVAGYDYVPSSTDCRWRIEKRRKDTGAIVWTQISNPSSLGDGPNAITSDSDYLYIGGADYNCTGYPQWRIEKRRKSDGGLVWAQTVNPGSNVDYVTAIVADGLYLYVVGQDTTLGGVNYQWRIEKRRKDTGALVSGWPIVSNPSNNASSAEYPTAVVVDSAYIYVCGGDYAPGNFQWRIEKRTKDTGALVSGWPATVNPTANGDVPYDMVGDSDYLYIVGQQNLTSSLPMSGSWRIEKRSKINGALIWSQVVNPESGVNLAWTVSLDGSSVYISGYANWFGDGKWYIEKRKKSDGTLDSNWPVTENPSTGFDGVDGILFDSGSLYIVGSDNLPGNYQWRIERRDLGFIDIGLRFWDGSSAVKIAAEPANPPTSAMRIAKEGIVYGLALVDTTDSMASKIRVQTSSGVKSLRKLE